MRKRWVFLGLLAVIVAVGAIGGTVMAQETEGDGDGAESRKDVIARVADKLDIDETELRTAFDEARAEIRDEQSDARIDKMVDAGRITAEEGEELKTWYDEPPGGLGRRSLRAPRLGPRIRPRRPVGAPRQVWVRGRRRPAGYARGHA